MNNTKRNWLLSSTIILALTACGGGSGSTDKPDEKPVEKPPIEKPPETKVSVAGKVIDGYVSGATVWLDINGNSVHDSATEPSVVSGAAGDYNFEFTQDQADCVPYATLFVDVPVGAEDEDYGTVTQAYQMAFPPSLAPLTDDELINISPLTSVLWDQLKQKIQGTNKENLTCAQLKEDTQLRSDLRQEISTVMWDLVGHYNITEAQIYADFIALGDSAAHTLAQSIVKGLQASYAHRVELEKQNPNAELISVVVYQDEAMDQRYNFDKAWYRSVYIINAGTNFSELVKLKGNDNLFEIDKVLFHLESTNMPWGDQSLQGRLVVREDIYINDEGGFICSGFELVGFGKAGISYNLVNTMKRTYSETMQGCETSFDAIDEREQYVTFTEDDVIYSAKFFFRSEQPEFNSLSNWVNFKDKENSLEAEELISHLSALPKGWDEDVLLDTFLWRKEMILGKVTTTKDSDGYWKKTTHQTDGTRVYECSTDGTTWTSCT
jgi:hypothetical protein